MDENRLQAYLNLINQLLNRPSEEVEILNANLDLVDEGLVQTLEDVANQIAADVPLEIVNLLRTWANQIKQKLEQSYIQVDLQLIKMLLNCPRNPESVTQILNANQALIDAELVQIMVQVADGLAQAGDRNAVEFLTDLAFELAEHVGLPSSALLPKYDSQNSLLEQIVQILSNQSDTQIIYQLLELNQELLDNHFVQVLRKVSLSKLSKAERYKIPLIATPILYLGTLLKDLPNTDYAIGNWDINSEIAITCFEVATKAFPEKNLPDILVPVILALSELYCNRRRGNKAENLEVAISYLESVQEVYTRTTFPAKWVTLQNELGNAYNQHIRGNRAENTEIAIRCWKNTLEIYTHQNSPEQWAMVQNNLGNGYLHRIFGEPAKNLEEAIACYSSALEVYTYQDLPEDWARTQHNLANAYSKRIRGNKVENLKTAFEHYYAALEVRNRKDYPKEWGMIHNNLGDVYRDYCQEAKIRNQEALKTCLAYFSAALEVRTRAEYPEEWANTQYSLGNAYLDFAENVTHLEAAIQHFIAALDVHTREAFPEKWADTQNSLGDAYLRNNTPEKRAENLEEAVRCFSNALQIRTREAFPQNYAQTQWNLGLTYQHAQKFIDAYNAYASAIDTVESLRGEIITGSGREEDKRNLAEEWNKLYQHMVEVCLILGKSTEALEYVERSKTRNLVELILNRDSSTIFPLETFTQLEQLNDEISRGQYQLQNSQTDNPTALAQHLEQLRQQRNESQDTYLALGHGFKFDKFQATLDDHTTIIQWYITSAGLETFIFTRNSLQRLIFPTSANVLKSLIDWINEYLEAYNQKKTEWSDTLVSRFSLLAEILHIDQIVSLVPSECDRLILIPHRFLHLLPLHALTLTNGDFLCDRFPNGVSYAPSCQLLLQAQQRKRPNFTHLFAIQNPTGDLTHTDLEVQAITNYFNPVDIFKKETATLTALNEANLNAIHCAHFSCHGYFNLTNPRKSALILADAPLATAPTQPDTERYLNVREGETHDLNQCLTLDAVLSLNLEQCRLVTLSACESGLIDFNNTSDEYIGLPSGFLIAGSPSVVSSLWKVNDVSTALLMIKFYQNLKSGLTVALALNQAQTWLPDATTAKLLEWTNSLNLNESLTQQIQKKLRRRASHEKPFHSPYHWAAFCAIGQ